MKTIIPVLLFAVMTSFTALAQKIPVHEPVRLLALGDSYTIGESVAPEESWPHQLADSLATRGIAMDEVSVIARTGWRTDELQEAIRQQDPGTDWNLVGLLIGVNNQYQGKDPGQYQREFEELLQKAIELAGNDATRVFVVSIPDYAFTPFGQQRDPVQITRELEEYNSINCIITTEYGIPYVYVTDISRNGLKDPSLVAEDGLHPGRKQYAAWVERILRILDY